MLGIGYVSIRQIKCSCSEFLRKIASTWNISQDKYNQHRYKGDNQNCIYWPILGYYNNWHIIHFIASKKQHKLSYNYINVQEHCFKHWGNTSENDYGKFSIIDKNSEN